jgi:hypothetical protein
MSLSIGSEVFLKVEGGASWRHGRVVEEEEGLWTVAVRAVGTETDTAPLRVGAESFVLARGEASQLLLQRPSTVTAVRPLPASRALLRAYVSLDEDALPEFVSVSESGEVAALEAKVRELEGELRLQRARRVPAGMLHDPGRGGRARRGHRGRRGRGRPDRALGEPDDWGLGRQRVCGGSGAAGPAATAVSWEPPGPDAASRATGVVFQCSAVGGPVGRAGAGGLESAGALSLWP